jgi:RNA polymerase sigma-70 factor, ECF subfamily
VQPPDDRALIEDARKGSSAAFEELVRRYDREVLRLALGLLRSEEDAREVYQETFLRVYRSLRDFRGESSFPTWVFRIVTNLCLDHLRRSGARRAEQEGRRESDRALTEPADGDPARDPERALASREVRHRIEAALDRLSPRERLVFEMRHYQGLRLRDIGTLLETSEETARNCLFRAHRDLRQALGDLRGFGSGDARGRVGRFEVET